MSIIALAIERLKVIIGVDTHKSVHFAVAISSLGARLGSAPFDADTAGYAALLEWARTFGDVIAVGIEGTGSYGAGLASFTRRQSIKIAKDTAVKPARRRSSP